MALIELDDVTKDYGSFRAIDGLSLRIGGGITGLLGPNGAGKSTLIKLILGLVRCSSGRGKVLGCDIFTESQRIRARIGYMPEDDCYLHGLSGVESVQMAAQLSRIPATEALRRAHEILDFCGMGQERYRTVETFSTGMRQKLRFAMAIVHDPELLILDEPTSGLDPEEREAMLNRIQVLARRMGRAVIVCTHILPDVQLICDRVVIMAAGRVTLNEDLDVVLRSNDPSVTVDLQDDASSFASALRNAGLRVDVLNERSLRVFGHGDQTLPAVWQAAHQHETAIRRLIPSRTSLEDVFLAAIQDSDRADS